MAGDPFAPLTRTARWRARRGHWRRLLLRPFRPRRIRPDRHGPPDLLLMGVDTLRADHVGCLGCPSPTTPRLDALADGGTVFTDVTAPAPWTLPSFAGALTGLMPGLHDAYLSGRVRNMDDQPPRRLAADAPTLAAHLRERGYRTAAFYSNQFFAFGLAESFDHHAYHNVAAEDLAAIALDWIGRHADRPYFCFVLFNDPHEPTTPPPGDLEPFLAGARTRGADDPESVLPHLARWGDPPLPHLGRVPVEGGPDLEAHLAVKLAVYAATVRQVDRSIGALQDRLQRWDLASRTVISVFADHGEEFRDHAAESAAWNHDPRGLVGVGHGHTQFQELLHVPWLAWGPGVPAGKRVEAPVSLCDLAPTLAGWLGAGEFAPTDSAAGRRAGAMKDALTGRSLAGGADQDSEQRLLLAEALAYGPDVVALRRGAAKLIAHRDGRPLALYDLVVDPEEKNDLLPEKPAVLDELLADLAAWRESGCGAVGDDGGGPGWEDLDDTVRQRLKDLGYAE
ncbi:MAG: sulfatase-like hydrolase/transferase [bacterium]|nr:sulfatase-like hydrolase/transferase [bacterium]